MKRLSQFDQLRIFRHKHERGMGKKEQPLCMPARTAFKQPWIDLSQAQQRLEQSYIHLLQRRPVSSDRPEEIIEQILDHNTVQINLGTVSMRRSQRLRPPPVRQAPDTSTDDIDRSAGVIDCRRQRSGSDLGQH